MQAVLDTHTLIWLILDSVKLSTVAKEFCQRDDVSFAISTMSLAELNHTFKIRRHAVSQELALSRISNMNNMRIVPLTTAIAKLVPEPLNIHDGVIVATALMLQNRTGSPCTVVTRDGEITTSGIVPVIW